MVDVEQVERWLACFKERDAEEVADWGKNRGFGSLLLTTAHW